MGYTFIKNFSAFSAQAQRKSNVADDSFVLPKNETTFDELLYLF